MENDSNQMKDNATEKTLKICRASAGSGKTFTLAVEYIKHLVMNPTSYRRILAVTFTNKATAEMKQRITSQLYGISRGLADSEDYVSKIKEDATIRAWYGTLTCKPGAQTVPPLEMLIRENCRKALTMILHDYHRFRIETIDSFFQTIIRELAHDLNLTANLKVELDNDGALKEGVSRVIDAICDDKQIRQRVLDYVNNKLEDNKNWTISTDLEKFGKNIFDENFLKFGKELREKLKEPDFLKNYLKNIQQLKARGVSQLNDIGEQFDDIYKRRGIQPDYLKNKSKNVALLFFRKLKMMDTKAPDFPNLSRTLLKQTEDINEWSKDKDIQAVVEQEQLMTMLANAIEKMKEVRRIILSVQEISIHLNQLSLINTISQKVNDAIGDRGEFLLANTNHFLNEMIDESDVPFIYERTGTHFEHIMIDEFQDTSVLQWENFKPLIKNCLDAGNECLIVGDVKQSIYRWRNGEWSILNNMSTDPQLKSFVKDAPLDTNYRSAARVITFNNEFFGNASNQLSRLYAENEGGDAQDILNAYNECKQEIPAGKDMKEGYVRVELKGKGEEEEEEQNDDNDTWYCDRITANVEKLLKAGIPQSQITILVRQNQQATRICDYFGQKDELVCGQKVSVTSAEAYRLDSSPAVRLIILALKMLQNPNDKKFRTMLAYYYQADVEGNSSLANDFDQLFINDIESLNQFLPKELTLQAAALALTPLYELCERLYSILSLHKIEGQDAYLFAFYDHVAHFLEGNNTDTENFITQWDEQLCKKKINNGSTEGIKIMTIHKSKGLEFHSVILPFADWEITDSRNKSNLIWCKPEDIPFSQLPLCPVRIVKDMKESVFATDYMNELLKQYVDNLNVLYVALTRASKNLIVISSDPNKKNTIHDILSQSMPKDWTAANAPDNPSLTIFEEKDATIVGFRHKEKKTDNVMTALPQMLQLGFTSGESKGEFRQSNKSRRFIQGEDIDEHRTKYLDEGILFHAILSEIQTLDDVEKAVARLDMEGCFDSVSHREDVRRLVEKAFQDPRSALWFSPQWTVINENAIVYRDKDGKTATCRPDRVITDGRQTIVIDYKTGIYRSEHEEQVAGYMNLLRQMGYNNVKGYLWYIRQQSIVEVNSTTSQ